MVEYIGWAATVAIVLSFLMNDLLKLRVTSLIGALLWLWYGIVTNIPSILFLNIIIVIIQIYKIYQLKRGKTKEKHD